MDAIASVPLPAALSGTVIQRVIEFDDALLYIVAGALWNLRDTSVAQTGILDEETFRAEILKLIEAFYV